MNAGPSFFLAHFIPYLLLILIHCVCVLEWFLILLIVIFSLCEDVCLEILYLYIYMCVCVCVCVLEWFLILLIVIFSLCEDVCLEILYLYIYICVCVCVCVCVCWSGF